MSPAKSKHATAATLLLALQLLGALSACTGEPQRTGSQAEITVFAASSLTDVFTELGQEYGASPAGGRVTLNFASSSQLAVQLLDGAPADLFASANQRQMERVQQADLLRAAPAAFASNSLVLIVPADNPAGIEAVADLASPGIRIITAVPGVPVREYTDQLLTLLESQPEHDSTFRRALEENIVSEEDNVRQVTAKVALGEADAAVVYASDVRSDLESDLQVLSIPEAAAISPRYFIAVLRSSRQPAAAQEFLEFLDSERAASILMSWGFTPLPTDG